MQRVNELEGQSYQWLRPGCSFTRSCMCIGMIAIKWSTLSPFLSFWEQAKTHLQTIGILICAYTYKLSRWYTLPLDPQLTLHVDYLMQSASRSGQTALPVCMCGHLPIVRTAFSGLIRLFETTVLLSVLKYVVIS